MRAFLGGICRSLFGIKADEVKFVRRGFRGATEEMQFRLEQIGATFRNGYHVALKCGNPDMVAACLPKAGAELQGFAYEGAAMGLALLDCITPWPSDRIGRFLRGAGNAHAYMVHVGVGWVWARLPWTILRRKERLNPLLRWLAFDGWGFHNGFFHWSNGLAGRSWPKQLSGYERRAFDQGLGRSFWFANGGNVNLIAETIQSFPAGRHADLWSGIGLAAVYAGIISADKLEKLCEAAGEHRTSLAQGAAFASKARLRAGNMSGYTDLAAGILCGQPARMAAEATDRLLKELSTDSDPSAYESWRLRIQNYFTIPERAMEG